MWCWCCAGMAVSNDGTLLVTFSHDQSVKIFDIVNFDMMHMLQLPFVPAAAEWVYRVRVHALGGLYLFHMQNNGMQRLHIASCCCPTGLH